MNKVFKSIVNISRRDNAFSYLIHFLYEAFSNEIFNAVANILGTVVIAIFISHGYYGLWFGLGVALYIIIIFMSAVSRNYARNRQKQLRMYTQSLYGLDEILRAWADTLKNSSTHIRNARLRERISPFIEDFDFQNAAIFVCKKLFSHLSAAYGTNNIYITVYMRCLNSKYDKDDFDSTKYINTMIACSDNHGSSSWDEDYEIPNKFYKGLKKEIPYHSYIFASGNNAIRVLSNKQEVDDYFVPHRQSESRERDIQQYIGIPISVPKFGIMFLLQIDTDIPKLFGKDQNEMKEFAASAIFPFSQFLYMAYEQSNMTDSLLKRRCTYYEKNICKVKKAKVSRKNNSGKGGKEPL